MAASKAFDDAPRRTHYDSHSLKDSSSQSRWNPRRWPRWALFAIPIAILLIIIAAVVGGVVGSRAAKANRYPDYTALKYSIADNYTGTTFFDNFNYFTGYDPTHGFVHYVPAETAKQYNLTYASSTSAVLRVDTSEKNASTGRFSVRVTSKKQYSTGLFVFDVLHSPYGCSTWPALWLTDPSNWPYNGEIDVIEAVNQASTGNQMTLHTSAGCSMSSVARRQTGSTLTTECLNSTNSNAGCGVQGSASTYGAALNAGGGGVYAMELRSAGIRMWFFARGSVPGDLVAGNDTRPDPSGWGTALADFPSTNCDVGARFANQSIIANIDLCGDWVNNVYATSGCPLTCDQFVATRASDFETAYWEWASWRVYSAS